MDLTIEELEAIFVNSSYTREEIIATFRAIQKSKRERKGTAREVFNDWMEVMEEPRALLDTRRIRIINRALETYTVDDLKLVNRGVLFSAWHMGTDPLNKTGVVFNFPEFIYKDAEQIEKFKSLALRNNITPDAAIRKSNYDGSKPRKVDEYTEFIPKKRIGM
jgi:hypothetical protein